MASTYSGNLAIELIGTGDQAGTWGQTTNTNLGTALEQAITSTASVTFTAGGNSAIALAQTNAFQAARSARLTLVGSTTATQYLWVPNINKQYIISNGLSNAIIISNGSNGAGTGATITVPPGKSMIVYNDSVNIIEVFNYANTLSVNNLTDSNLTNANLTNANLTNANLTNANLVNSNLANPTVNAYTESVVAIGSSTSTQTINIANSTIVTATLTANCTWTMPSNTAGKSFILLLKTGNGGFTSTFTGVKFPANTAPTITTANNSMDILTFVADGANWYGNFAQGYVP